MFTSKNYKNPVIDISYYRSDKYEINLQMGNGAMECILCGKEIKHSSKHYQIVAGEGNELSLIHKDEWDYACSKQNTDGGFMGCWDIGSSCIRKLKNIPNIKNYIRKPQKI